MNARTAVEELVPNDKFRWTDGQLDGATSCQWRVQTTKPLRALMNERQLMTELPPGIYSKGAAYISHLVDDGGNLSLGLFKQKYVAFLPPEVKAYLLQYDEWFPLTPEGENVSTHNIWWVPLRELQACGTELITKEQFTGPQNELPKLIKQYSKRIAEIARGELKEIYADGTFNHDTYAEKANEDSFQMAVSDLIPNLELASENHDEVWDQVFKIYNDVAINEFGATPEDLEL
jgi:hypothetical protein